MRKEKEKEAANMAKSRGGALLSKYTNNRDKLEWKCSRGHTWKAAFTNIQRGKWCPHCAGNARLTMEDMSKIALDKKGKCISDTYQNNHTKLTWECCHGHQWEARPMDILKGKWCPICAASFGERACIEIARQLTGHSFTKVRPDWLEGLELDGYCATLSVAIEYNGKYHYERVFSWQSTASLNEIKRRDRKKARLCAKRGITLIVIEEDRKQPLSQIESEIRRQMSRAGIPANGIVDSSKVYSTSKLSKYREIAISKGGDCLSEAYITSQTKLKWRCAEGHEWPATPNSIQQGAWCPTCANRPPLSLAEAKAIANSRGGDCLSQQYRNCHDKMKWVCSEGHEWEASLTSIKHNKSWCPECATAMPSEKSAAQQGRKNLLP
jgi:hypothetical protein